MRLSRTILSLLLYVLALSIQLAAQSLTAHIERDQLHVSAPRVHFLIGSALERLRDGGAVRFDFQITARSERGGKVLVRSQETFVVSYDLWEEKFAVTKLGSSPRTVSHLSTAAAEAWCIDNTSLAVGSLSGARPFWVGLEYAANEAPDPGVQPDNSSFTLSSLVDIFSRRARKEQVHGSEEIGPLTLDKIRRK